MAANVKSEDSFKQLHDCFSSVNEDLKRWYEACVLQRFEVESRIQGCKKLLKPWPSQKKDQNSQDNTDSKTQSTQDNMPLKEEDVEKPNPDLELLDKILEKAHKARKIQNKIDSENSSGDAKRLHRPTTAAHVSKEQKNIDATAQKSATKSKQEKKIKPVTTATKSLATARPPSSKAVVKQPVLLRKNKAVPLKTTYGATYGRTATSKPVSGGRTHSVKDAVAGTSNIQVPLQDSDPKEKPKGLKEKSLKADINSSKVTVEKERGTKITKTKESSEPSSVITSNKQTDGSEIVQNAIPEDSDFVQRAKQELSRISADLKDINARKQDLSKRDKTKYNTDTQIEKEKNESKVEIETENSPFVKPFLLSEEGHTLTLPPKYRKLKSSHYKLISQLIKGSRTSDQSENNFVKRLESQFDFNEASSELVQDKIQALEQAQNKLLVYLQWISDRTSHDSETFSWQHVYKSYRHWQVLLGKFRELQKGTQELLTAEENQQRWCPCGGCVTTKEMSSHFIRSEETNNRISRPRPACLLYSSWFVPVSTRTESAFDYRPNMECVTYRSEKELHMLNESLHNLQMSEIDLHLQAHFGKNGIDALQGLDVTHWSFPLIYRALWGLVCCDGKAFPSVVQHSSSD